MLRSDVLVSKLALIEDSGGEISVVTSPAGVPVWRRICVIDRDGVMDMVIKPTLMMISSLYKCLAES